VGNLVTRTTLHRHSYAPVPVAPVQVYAHAVAASVPSAMAGHGPVMFPVSAPLASYAADGAPYYNSGYLAGYPSTPLPGGQVPLQLPDRAAMFDLSDRTSWDRPVLFPGSR
jgi:hypothetical protein